MNQGSGVTGVLPEDPFHNDPPPPPDAEGSRWPIRVPLAAIVILSGMIIFGASLGASISAVSAPALDGASRQLEDEELGEVVPEVEPVVKRPPAPVLAATTWGMIAGGLWILTGSMLWADRLIPTAVSFLLAAIASGLFFVPI